MDDSTWNKILFSPNQSSSFHLLTVNKIHLSSINRGSVSLIDLFFDMVSEHIVLFLSQAYFT